MSDLQIPGETPALPGFPSIEADAAVQRAEHHGEYTAERIRERRPDIYKAIIKLHASGMGQLRIADILSVHHRTIAAVLRDAPDAVAMAKKDISRRSLGAAGALLERIEEDIQNPIMMAKTPLKDKAVAAAVLVDKGMLTAGEATERLEVVVPDGESFDDYMAGLKRTGAGAESPGKGAAGSGRPGLDFIEVGEGDAAPADMAPGAEPDSQSGAGRQDSKGISGGARD